MNLAEALKAISKYRHSAASVRVLFLAYGGGSAHRRGTLLPITAACHIGMWEP
jgi:hypothetical protein